MSKKNPIKNLRDKRLDARDERIETLAGMTREERREYLKREHRIKFAIASSVIVAAGGAYLYGRYCNRKAGKVVDAAAEILDTAVENIELTNAIADSSVPEIIFTEASNVKEAMA